MMNAEKSMCINRNKTYNHNDSSLDQDSVQISLKFLFEIIL